KQKNLLIVHILISEISMRPCLKRLNFKVDLLKELRQKWFKEDNIEIMLKQCQWQLTKLKEKLQTMYCKRKTLSWHYGKVFVTVGQQQQELFQGQFTLLILDFQVERTYVFIHQT